jgi:hypothetical protein
MMIVLSALALVQELVDELQRRRINPALDIKVAADKSVPQQKVLLAREALPPDL